MQMLHTYSRSHLFVILCKFHIFFFSLLYFEYLIKIQTKNYSYKHKQVANMHSPPKNFLLYWYFLLPLNEHENKNKKTNHQKKKINEKWNLLSSWTYEYKQRELRKNNNIIQYKMLFAHIPLPSLYIIFTLICCFDCVDLSKVISRVFVSKWIINIVKTCALAEFEKVFENYQLNNTRN